VCGGGGGPDPLYSPSESALACIIHSREYMCNRYSGIEGMGPVKNKSSLDVDSLFKINRLINE
jgi:hypothetical protein